MSEVKKTVKSAKLVLFMTVFIDLVGFGIIIPLSPYLARKFEASPSEIGWLLAIYSIMQFIFSPIWGRMSDRIGRRPVILVSLLGGFFSYLLFAFATTLPVLFVARALAGIFGGNISAAHAYMADITSEADRSKGMGMIGAAFGLGFIFGPLIGGGLAQLGMALGSEPPLGLSLAALGAAVICFANFFFAYFRLAESYRVDADINGAKSTSTHAAQPRLSRLQAFSQLVRHRDVAKLILIFFLSGLAMANMEAMLFPYVEDLFSWSLIQSSMGFAYVGVLMVITQGWLIRKWMPRWGESSTLMIGLILFAVSLFALGMTTTVATFGVSMTILALGNGLMRPPNVGMISLLTPKEHQGAVMGVTNSIASLGRILGPIMGGLLYERLSHAAPFFVAGGLIMVAALILVSQLGTLSKLNPTLQR